MRIWIGTWNCEQQFPTDDQLAALFGHCSPEFNWQNCDLVVLGLQECSRGHGAKSLPGYSLINHLVADGQTKNKENCQAVFVWEKMSGMPRGTAQIVDRMKSVVERDFKKRLKFWAEYGKGSANLLVEWKPAPIGQFGKDAEPWRIAISSCHLDSKSADKRASQIQDAMNAPSTLAPEGRWDVQFMMGDLNFRVNKGRTYSLNEFCNAVFNNRGELFSGDSLKNDDTLKGPWWVFPPPYAGPPGSVLQWPTYKKWYKGTEGAKARQVSSITPSSIPMLWDIKVDKQGNVKEGERAGQYDFGWLDRVGYRVNGTLRRKVKLLYSGSPPSLILSDHAPAYSIFEVT